MAKLTYNKGEWSELYALLKIFDIREIPAADENLMPTKNKYRFLGVFREDEPDELKFYNLEHDGTVAIESGGRTVKIIDSSDLPQKTRSIFAAILNSKERTFAIPVAIEQMNKYALTKVKAGSWQKADLDALVQDNIASRQELGFSIKSQLGGASTLLNASRHTNFKYKIHSIDDNDAKLINAEHGVKQKVKRLLDDKYPIEFIGASSQTFTNNMRLVDTVLPNIIGIILLAYFNGSATSIDDLCHSVTKYGLYGLDYIGIRYKVENFLRTVALGMVPSKPWSTKLSAYGGYLVVKSNGDIVCYHLYNDDDFKDYLFNNTKLDTPDPRRHDFGYLYKENSEYYINLNLQIRFMK